LSRRLLRAGQHVRTDRGPEHDRNRHERNPSRDGGLPVFRAPPTGTRGKIEPVHKPRRPLFRSLENVIYDTGEATIVTSPMKSSSGNASPRWSLVTNHGQVLACVAADPNARLRDVAESVGITERTAAQIVNDLEQGGYLSKTRVGRRNRYQIVGGKKVRTPRLGNMTTGQLLPLLTPAPEQHACAD